MRNRRISFLRVFAVFAVLISMVGSLSLPAMAAPANQGNQTPGAYQAELLSLELCLDLEAAAIVDASGLFIGDIDAPALVTVLLDLGLGADLDLLGLAGVIIGDGCATYLPIEPEPVYLESFLTATGPATGTWETYYLDWTPIANGSFVNGETVSLGAYNDASEFRVSVYADGWDSATTTFVGGEGVVLAMTATPPAVVVAVLFVDPAVDGTFIGSCGGSPVSGTFTAGTAVMGQVYEGAYCEVTLSADGYEDGSASGYITDEDENGSGPLSGSLGAVIPATYSVIGGVVDAETFAPISGATVEVYSADGLTFITSTTTAADGTFSIAGLAPGSYYLPATASGYDLGGGSITIEDADVEVGFALTPTAVEPVPATLSAELCVAIGADEDGLVVQADIDAAITAGLLDPVVDAELIVSLLDGACAEFVAPPVETTGLVYVTKVYCEDLDEVVFNGDDDDDCALGAATFSFYLIGDGTADYQQLEVWEDGFGAIELEAGSYEVVEEGTLATTTIDVVAGEVTGLTVANPGEAPAPRDGTVNISIFTCNNIDEVIFTSDGFMVMALPTFEPACEPGAATLTFYLVGDGTDDFTQIDVDGTGSLVLAPGTYEVVEEGTQASTFITVFAGDFITLDIQIPAGGEVVPGSSVNVVKFYCDTVTETEFLAMNSVEYSDRDELAGAPDCVSGYATFTFYLYGDGTDDYAQLAVNGSGTIGLEPGLYEVVEEETQARFDLEVLDGENTFLFVNNPMPEDGEVPDGSDDGDDDADHGDDKDADTGKTDVTKLPSTGSGMTDGSGLLMIAAAAAAAISGAGALTLRNKR